MNSDSASDHPLCSSCRKRPVTNYICYGGTGKSMNLCDECMILEDPASATFTAEAKSAKCVYCGGFPCSGGPDSLSQMTGGPVKNRWMCMSCAPEYYSVFQTELGKIMDGLPNSKQIEEIQKIGVAIDMHMREYVRHRDN